MKFRFKKKSRIGENETKDFQPKNGYMIFFAGCSFIISFVLICLYSYSPYTFDIAGFELKKLTFYDYNSTFETNLISEFKDTLKSNYTIQKDTINISNSANVLIDSINTISKSASDSFIVDHQQKLVYSDSTEHRVMIMGDSECAGLCYQLNKYCLENKHNLVASLIWYSATINNFAYSDTIDKIIRKIQPTYIFFVVGLNELYAKDLEKKKDAAIKFLTKIKDIPFIWIGPANFTEDKGINKVYELVNNPGCFFLTKGMNLPKSSDGRHPNFTGYQLWMDSIANWIKVKSKHKIAMSRPSKKNYPFKSKMLIFNAVKFRGY